MVDQLSSSANWLVFEGLNWPPPGALQGFHWLLVVEPPHRQVPSLLVHLHQDGPHYLFTVKPSRTWATGWSCAWWMYKLRQLFRSAVIHHLIQSPAEALALVQLADEVLDPVS